MDSCVQLIVGLGNPGQKYDRTRHNAGADFVLEFAHQQGIELRPESRFFGATGRTTLSGQDVRLLIPSTFMNRSGQAVGAMAGFYNIPAESILIVHDELDLDPGTARFKKGGGHGGHNGLRDCISALGNNREFARLRIGIGHPGHASEVVSYVLCKPSPGDSEQIESSIASAIDALPLALNGDWEKAMTQLHSAS